MGCFLARDEDKGEIIRVFCKDLRLLSNSRTLISEKGGGGDSTCGLMASSDLFRHCLGVYLFPPLFYFSKRRLYHERTKMIEPGFY